MADNAIEIPARRGKAARVEAGQAVKVINTHGTQVVDTWAFNADDLGEFMSMEATRSTILKLVPAVGDTLYTNNRRPILTLTEDTTPGVHDTLLAACDRYRYELLGCEEYHDNCTDNLSAAMAELGLKEPETPSPLNLFMNIPWTADGALSFEETVSSPGEFVVLKAEMDLIIAFSACPQDMLPINGRSGVIVEAHFEIN
jgi:uncharacterized protein YcgI (DUF1989 family)